MSLPKLFETLDQHTKLVQQLQQQLNDVQQYNKHDWRMVMRQYLLDIRNHIEELADKETQLENNNLILKNKIFHLNQEIQELTVSRQKLSPTKTSSPTGPKPQIMPITTTTFLKQQQKASHIIPPISITHMNPMIPQPVSPVPVETFQPQTLFTYKNWTFQSLKNPMADSKQIEAISKTLGIKTLPEMVFPHSYLKVALANSLEMHFEAINGLKPCIGEPPKAKQVQVQYAKEWKNKAKAGKDVQRLKFNYDWTFTTNYRGDYKSLKPNKMNIEHDVKERFNMSLLKDTSSPILWSCHCILYEDELSDNGMSQLLVRCRVMPRCFLILLRYWLRVDNVIIRVNDTRIYHEFGSKFVVKHTEERESKWSKLKTKYPTLQAMQFNDPNRFSDKIDVIRTVYDKINL